MGSSQVLGRAQRTTSVTGGLERGAGSPGLHSLRQVVRELGFGRRSSVDEPPLAAGEHDARLRKAARELGDGRHALGRLIERDLVARGPTRERGDDGRGHRAGCR